MDMDTTPTPDIGAAEDIGDVQISEIVEQELATAVADPVAVYVVSVEFEGDTYTSVHTSQAGADARLQETAERWGIPDVLAAERLTHRITKVPLETP